jgi:hypothetical protein
MPPLLFRTNRPWSRPRLTSETPSFSTWTAMFVTRPRPWSTSSYWTPLKITILGQSAVFLNSQFWTNCRRCWFAFFARGVTARYYSTSRTWTGLVITVFSLTDQRKVIVRTLKNMHVVAFGSLLALVPQKQTLKYQIKPFN